MDKLRQDKRLPLKFCKSNVWLKSMTDYLHDNFFECVTEENLDAEEYEANFKRYGGLCEGQRRIIAVYHMHREIMALTPVNTTTSIKPTSSAKVKAKKPKKFVRPKTALDFIGLY